MAIESTNIHMPRFVDGLPQFFFWELDDVIVYVLSLLIGILTRELTAMFFIGIIIVKLFSMWKSNRLPGALTHLANRHLSFPINKRFRNGHNTDYIQ